MSEIVSLLLLKNVVDLKMIKYGTFLALIRLGARKVLDANTLHFLICLVFQKINIFQYFTKPFGGVHDSRLM